jgi:hypothetical protein
MNENEKGREEGCVLEAQQGNKGLQVRTGGRESVKQYAFNMVSGEFFILDDYYFCLYATTLTIEFYICYFWLFTAGPDTTQQQVSTIFFFLDDFFLCTCLTADTVSFLLLSSAAPVL